jgi:hypothetical protein
MSTIRACGLSDDAILTRVRNGRLHARYRGVYALGHANVPLEGCFLAAVKACGSEAVLSHFPAAALYGLVQAVAKRRRPPWGREATSGGAFSAAADV